ncbi:unnamed protein product [Ilex paraguariensis]|uniref:USP domain-containing protein n=1 Tax=Ilex paraguariensis TaxID=185542 RepID=A0ABC8U8C6_9AQUA
MDSQSFGYNFKQPRHEKTLSDDIVLPSASTLASATAACTTMHTSEVPMMDRKSMEKLASCKFNREMLREEGTTLESFEQTYRSRARCSTSSDSTPPKEPSFRHKLRESDSMPSEEIAANDNVIIRDGFSNGQTNSNAMHGSHEFHSQNESIFDSRTNFGTSNSLSSAKHGMSSSQIGTNLIDGGNLVCGGITSNDETAELNCSSGRTSMKRSTKAKTALGSPGNKMYKSPKSSREQPCSDMEWKDEISNEPTARVKETIPAKGSNGVTSMGIMKMIGLVKSSKLDRQESSVVIVDRHKKMKMLFPYEEFVKFFQYEVYDLVPRGLINCGNSCYANAVLQCLTCTKPLTIYLLHRSHSRACCVKDWCLVCELEQHVMTLKESGGPLSPSKILLHMRRINGQIGVGSQEDAHEFLRFLVTSMQSICLEGLGGENVVDPRLQETTFIQHTFGGRLKSKVKCLRCHHQSERYENIMDLTLEIFGWVESLEDALTQFTSTEDLDGENMYRCGRCAAYVRARKQLSIQEAPNILTIVLKRFQEGSYGKINKCITFPDMLDMVPFMTGTDDIPPLYMLYAVVVHLDTLNASFSGHYISYVKDMQGNWFRIDDTQVLPVPMTQVMSEGAYILFYMRSFPRPARACAGKPTQHRASSFAKHWTAKTPKPSRPGQSKSSCHLNGQEPSLDYRRETNMGFNNHSSNGILRSANRNRPPGIETYAESMSMEFSDATSSDWSIFTSSDDASFTTDSTRDSFSTIDYADACSTDPLSSIFNTLYAPEYSSRKTVSCRMFSSSKSQTKFVPEGKDFVVNSYLSSRPHGRVQRGENTKQVSSLPGKTFLSDGTSGVYIKHGSNPKDGPCRTSVCCKQ